MMKLPFSLKILVSFCLISGILPLSADYRTGCCPRSISYGHSRYEPSSVHTDVFLRSSYLNLEETRLFLKSPHSKSYFAMAPYQTVQRNGTSCSLASATMILNTIRDLLHGSPQAAATQNEVLEMVNDPLWDNATSDQGPGVTLEQYETFLRKMFAAYRLPQVAIEKVYVTDDSQATRQKIHQDLLAIASGNLTTFLLLDFECAIFMLCEPMGHISPVGGYDPVTGKVLIMDVDREWTGPYWLTEETVVKGLNTLDDTEGLSEPTYRGYIRITLTK